MSRKKKKAAAPATETGHPTALVPLKWAWIDTGIAPVVKWLNHYDSVWTLYSCQGDPEPDVNSPALRPYVLFLCTDRRDLEQILNVLGISGGWHVEVDRHEGQMRYNLVFADPEQVELFIREYLEER